MSDSSGSTTCATAALPRCGDFATLVGMAHPLYCHREKQHNSDHCANSRIADGGVADVYWSRPEDDDV